MLSKRQHLIYLILIFMNFYPIPNLELITFIMAILFYILFFDETIFLKKIMDQLPSEWGKNCKFFFKKHYMGVATYLL